jgi:hypothetical protein
MSYTPSFTEVFFGYLVVLFWSAWLGRKGHAPALMHYGPIVLVLLFGLALAVATRAIMLGSQTELDTSPIDTARAASLALVVLGLAVDAGFTVRHFLTRSAPPAPGP